MLRIESGPIVLTPVTATTTDWCRPRAELALNTNGCKFGLQLHTNLMVLNLRERLTACKIRAPAGR